MFSVANISREGEMTAVAGPFGLTRIGQIAVTIRDRPRAVAFYRDILGMRLLFEVPPKMAFFDCCGIRLMPVGGGRGQEANSVVGPLLHRR